MQSAEIDGANKALDVLVIVPEAAQDDARLRLATSVGNENACRLHHAFLNDLDEHFRRSQAVDSYDLYWALPTDSDPLGTNLVSETSTLEQRGEDVAERRFNICRDVAAQGYQRVIILISEFPNLPAAIVRQGLEALDRRHVVLAPGNRCGYYLVGVHLYPEVPNLFAGIKMDTSTVLAQTLVRAADLDCSVALLTSTVGSGDLGDLRQLLEVLRQPGNARGPRTTRELLRQVDIFCPVRQG